jgi:hypothetical protein
MATLLCKSEINEKYAVLRARTIYREVEYQVQNTDPEVPEREEN